MAMPKTGRGLLCLHEHDVLAFKRLSPALTPKRPKADFASLASLPRYFVSTEAWTERRALPRNPRPTDTSHAHGPAEAMATSRPP